MIIDCHTHISSVTDSFAVAEHLAAAETVDACIVLANADDASREVNRKLSEYVGRHKEKLVGFAFIDPTKDNVSVKAIAAATEKIGLKGVVLHCASCGFHPAHSSAMQFYEAAQELALPIFFHNGDLSSSDNAVLSYVQPFLLDEIARTFPSLKIVIGNMGEPFVEQTLSMVAKHRNVYADLTVKAGSIWQVYNTVVAAYESGIMDRLLFGSGFPSGRAVQCIETLLGFNRPLGDTNLPAVPRSSIRSIIERDTLEVLGIRR